jgi:hypothetical protein
VKCLYAVTADECGASCKHEIPFVTLLMARILALALSRTCGDLPVCGNTLRRFPGFAPAGGNPTKQLKTRVN